MKKLSVAIATYNEANKLNACLLSVAGWTDEIVLVDGGSTDATVEIAKKHTNKIEQTTNPPIFHINKQKSLDLCKGEWILQLDADEIVTESLKREILSTISSEASSSDDGYYIPRKNYFLGYWMKKGGQYPDYVIRLFRNGKGSFPAKSVHEQIAIDGSVGYLKEPLIHHPYNSMSEYMIKAHRYSSLVAAEIRGALPLVFIQYVCIKPVSIFFSLYVRHKGFLDGGIGLLYAVLSAFQFPMAFVKYYNINYGKSIN